MQDIAVLRRKVVLIAPDCEAQPVLTSLMTQIKALEDTLQANKKHDSADSEW